MPGDAAFVRHFFYFLFAIEIKLERRWLDDKT
jgi:hypothetical protein